MAQEIDDLLELKSGGDSPLEERVPTPESPPDSGQSNNGDVSSVAHVLLLRYRDAYREAQSIVNAGSILKVVGWIVAACIVLGGLIAEDAYIFAASAVVAFSVGTGFYFLGVVVAAQGQVMLANLDTAINTSPLLDDDKKAQAIARR